MSFLPINEQNQMAPQGQTTPNPMGTPPPQGGGSTGAGATGPTKGSATGTPTQFGSSASKLGDYLSANAPQIQNQANTMAGNLNQRYGQISQKIGDVGQQFGSQVQGGYAAPNQDVVNQAIANPTQFASNPENVKAFQAQYNNQYTGPQNFESFSPYTQISGDVQNAVQQGNLLQNQAGLQSYLQGQGKNPTRASSTLDALLMRGNPEAQQTVSNAAKQFGGLTGQLENARTGGNESVQAAQKAAQDAAAYAQGQFNPYVQNFNNTLQNQLTTAQGDVNTYNASIPNYLNQANDLGRIANEWNNWQSEVPNFAVTTQDISNPFASFQPLQPVNAPTMNQIATPEQLATQKALSQLGGQELNTIDPNNPIGGYKSPVGGTDLTGNVSDIEKALTGSYNTSKQNLLNALPEAWMQRDVYPQLSNELGTEYMNLMKQLNKYAPVQQKANPSYTKIS